MQLLQMNAYILFPEARMTDIGFYDKRSCQHADHLLCYTIYGIQRQNITKHYAVYDILAEQAQAEEAGKPSVRRPIFKFNLDGTKASPIFPSFLSDLLPPPSWISLFPRCSPGLFRHPLLSFVLYFRTKYFASKIPLVI